MIVCLRFKVNVFLYRDRQYEIDLRDMGQPISRRTCLGTILLVCTAWSPILVFYGRAQENGINQLFGPSLQRAGQSCGNLRLGTGNVFAFAYVVYQMIQFVGASF